MKDKLVYLLYRLGRDYLPLGVFEQILSDIHEIEVMEIADPLMAKATMKYTNRQLEVYAREVEERLRDKS